MRTTRVLARLAGLTAAAAWCTLSLPVFSQPLPQKCQQLDERHTASQDAAGALALAEGYLERDDSPELRWRVGRAMHQQAMLPATPAAQRLALLTRAYAEITNSKAELVGVRERAAALRWSGIVLSDLSALQGTKATILASYAIHSDFEEALEVDPTDASAHHLLGQWCFKVATLGPWMRWLAASLYAEPPTSSLEEARECFERAEELRPGFWLANQAMLAKCCAAQGEVEAARLWATKACALPVLTEDDRAHLLVAKQVLAALPARKE